MRGFTGLVGPDGRSALPEGIVDTSEGAESLRLDQALEEKLNDVFKSAVEDLDNVRARFKLELVFVEGRSAYRAYPGLVVAWTNGGFANGGGDESIMFCGNEIEAKGGGTKQCCAPIDPKLVSRGVAVCASCQRASNPKKLQGQRFARLYTQQWVDLLVQYFVLLGCNADIRIGIMRGELRKASGLELERNHGGEKLRAVRDSREWIIYPLGNIIKDTASGSSLQKCFRAFLSA